MSSEAERFALNDQLVWFVVAKMHSVQKAENVHTGTKNATVLAPSPPLPSSAENSRAARAGTAKMHLNHSLCKKIRRVRWRENSALASGRKPAPPGLCRTRFRDLLMIISQQQ
jgi:hypothetical protein